VRWGVEGNYGKHTAGGADGNLGVENVFAGIKVSRDREHLVLVLGDTYHMLLLFAEVVCSW
jgi:hypothetical protein